MIKKKASRLFTFVRLVGINLFVFFAIIFSLEVLTRSFTKVNFMGTSKNLFISSGKGQIINCKQCKAKAFGVDVFTDKHGLRVEENYAVDGNIGKDIIIIIGDSVGFGVGVEYNNTFQGQLSKKFTNYKFENHSVIAHNLNDHLITTEKILANEHKNKIRNAFLIYCLNDISSTSSYEIKEKLSADLGSKNSANRSDFGLVKLIKGSTIGSSINAFLRDKSILYLWIKGILTSPQERMFYMDTKPYQQEIHTIEEALHPLLDTSDAFRSKNIPFTVIISPYAYQLQTGSMRKNKDIFRPQKIVSDYLKKNKINYVDATSMFLQYTEDGSELFLSYDPMHLSESGHLLLHKVIMNHFES